MPVCTGQIALKRSATSKWDTLHFPLLCGHSHRECPSECKANCARACVSQRIRGPFTCVRQDSRRPFYYLWYSLIFCWSSSVAAHARTYSFCSSGTTMDTVYEFSMHTCLMNTDFSSFSCTFLFTARIPVSSSYFTFRQPHSRRLYIRPLIS